MKLLSSTTADALVRKAYSLQRFGKLQIARNLYQQALLHEPEHLDALRLFGDLERKLRNYEDALALFERVIKINRSDASVLNNRGITLSKMGRAYDALLSFSEAVRIKPHYAEAHFNLGNTFGSLGRFEDAVASYQEAIRIRDDYHQAYVNLGNLFRDFGHFDQALNCFKSAIERRRDYFAAHFNLGTTHLEMKRFEESLQNFSEAIHIDQDSVDAYNNRGVAFHHLGRFEEAMSDFKRAISLNLSFAEVFFNYGNTLQSLGKFNDAVVSYREAIRIRPDFYAAQFNLSLLLLLLGKYQEGWEAYEVRLKKVPQAMRCKINGLLLWKGDQKIEGKRLFLFAEQGYGDVIQFIRYLPLLQNLGAEIFLEIPQALNSIIRTSFPSVNLFNQGDPIPECDSYCSILSLPYAFQTTLETIPASVPYLVSDEHKTRLWRDRIAVSGQGYGRLKVGLVWNGGYRPLQPEAREINERRNIPLNVFARYLQNNDVDFFSIQKGDPAESEVRGRELDLWPIGNFHNYSSLLLDFSDSSALIENLDLVISVDTSVAHLAGAMGKPIWILNRFDTCWRWLLERGVSPWYPTAKLFRQSPSRSWTPVLESVADALEDLVRDRRRACSPTSKQDRR